MSLGGGAYKVGGAGQCSSTRRRYPWQPCEQPPLGTIILNNLVEYNTLQRAASKKLHICHEVLLLEASGHP